MDELAQVAAADERSGLKSSFASELVKLLKASTTKIFSALVPEIAATQVKNVPDMEVRQTLEKSAYLMGEMLRRYLMLIWITDSSEI